MAVVADTGSLYDAQTATPTTKQRPGVFGGRVRVVYSYLAAVTGGGQAGDYVDLMLLPKGAYIVGGWVYIENGLGGTDNETADLGIIYAAGDGTDDGDALLDGIDIYDGASVTTGQLAAIPAGFTYMLGCEMASMPFGPLEGEGTVRLISKDGDFVTAKDIKCCIFYVVD